MSQFVIEGGYPLSGTISVNGSKNAALPLLAATLLTKETVILSNIPAIRDVENLITILKTLGAEVKKIDSSGLVINAKDIDASRLPSSLVGQLRGSVLLMGALLGRLRQVNLPQPGGDVIGARPIDVHLDAFAQLGAVITQKDGTVHIDGSNLKAGTVVMKEFSVTATENIMMTAASLPGTTTINIAAAEPHVECLGRLLTALGATVTGAGTHTVTVQGTSTFGSATLDNIQDMIEAGCFILLAAATGSQLQITGVPIADLALFFKKINDIGVRYAIAGDTVTVTPAPLKPFRLQTLPYPGIATDLQAPFSILGTQAEGASLIHDPMYEGRFKYADELIKMGAKITVCDPHRIIVEGPTQLSGRHIKGLDIRAGVTLIFAGLVAQGTTVIDGAEIIDRGYADLDARLRRLGAHITRKD